MVPWDSFLLLQDPDGLALYKRRQAFHWTMSIPPWSQESVLPDGVGMGLLGGCATSAHASLASTALLVLLWATMWLLVFIVSFHQMRIPVSHLSLSPCDQTSVLTVQGATSLKEPAGSGPVSYLKHLHSCFFFSRADAARGPRATLWACLSFCLSDVLLCLCQWLSYLSTPGYLLCSSVFAILPRRSLHHPNGQVIYSTQIFLVYALVSLWSSRIWPRYLLTISTQLSHYYVGSVCLKLVKLSSIHTWDFLLIVLHCESCFILVLGSVLGQVASRCQGLFIFHWMSPPRLSQFIPCTFSSSMSQVSCTCSFAVATSLCPTPVKYVHLCQINLLKIPFSFVQMLYYYEELKAYEFRLSWRNSQSRPMWIHMFDLRCTQNMSN